ncbi:hypothetical protein [Paenibacillus senegalimassiliensis]|uniref:hypothetical protein n=1 Tax=Paenibacillus senegalimassiliensis TaxID=1737426 RepID=UPI0011DD2B4B|nr:hypothetical protein [Paenibacillus senegalimassiliensis]
MAQINNVIRVELDPSEPVPESCQVIRALIGMYPPPERLVILEAIQEELSVAVNQLKGVGPREQVRTNNGQQKHKRGLGQHKPRPGQR